MKDHTNVLLLALSTFPNDRNIKKTFMRQSNFRWDGKEYTGIYQLDPVPKMLADQLAQTQEYLDKMILLCTKQTIEKEETVEITYSNGQIGYYQGTALSYFKSQIESYMNPEVEDKFIIVEIDEKNIEEGISETINKVREIQNPKLYMDTHGGFREIFLVAEAVISLLKIDGIEAQGIYGVEFGRKDDGTDNNKIVDGSGGFHIFDFVSGMNEFINYGRTDSLEAFLQKHMEKDRKTSEQQEKLISCIKKISEGIQLCNIPAYEDGLNKLTEYYQDREPRKDLDGHSYLFIFEENIKNDYGVLLSSERTLIDEIKWCRKKGFYQQVLTLIESRIPQYLKSIGLCEYHLGEKDKDVTNVFNQCVPWRYYGKGPRANERIDTMEREWHPCQRVQSEGKSFYLENTTTDTKMKFNISEDKKALLDEFLMLHVDLKNIRNQSNHALAKNKNALSYVDEKITRYLEKLEKLCSC